VSRPLIVSDCDEVLLHMVAPFRDWLAESQGVIFEMRSSDFAQSMRRADSGEMLDKLEIWGLLGAARPRSRERSKGCANWPTAPMWWC
jgi:hypothetical protein